MWRMHDGNRVLTDAEWEVFATGLDLLRDFIESDISAGEDDTDTGVPAFDRLTAEQKLALLADVAAAVRDPAVPMPRHTAANEGAIMAVFHTARDMLETEIDAATTPGGGTGSEVRRAILAACPPAEDREEPLPDLTSTDPDAWDWLLEEIESRVFWDYDFDLGDEVLDLPPDQARVVLEGAGIDPDYFLAVPAEPDERGLTAARKTLARLIGLAVPDDNGLYPTLMDLYHDLNIGPLTPNEADTWADHPWVQVVGFSTPGWDCNLPTWRAKFGGAVPTTPFRVLPAGTAEDHEMPNGCRVEPSGAGWVVRDDEGSYWCGLVENGWTDTPGEHMPALAFPTEADARAAVIQAGRMYGERAERHAAAVARLGLSDRPTAD